MWRDELGGPWCPPPPRWWGLLGFGVVAIAAMACAPRLGTSGSASPESSQAMAPRSPASTEPAPVATPLVELDATASAPRPVTPAVGDEPLPFDADQLERIYAVQDIVAAASVAHGVEPALINALIWVESKFERRARGPAGAQGLMQLMPKTAGAMAKRLDRKRDSHDPDFNIHAGTLLLSRLLVRFDGDVTLALAGYNRGGGTVSKWIAAGEPLPDGAQGFADRVLRAKAWFDRLPARPSKRGPAPAKPKPMPKAKSPGAAGTVSSATPSVPSTTPT